MDRKNRKIIISSIIAVTLITVLTVLAFLLYMEKQAEKIPAMTADECIR